MPPSSEVPWTLSGLSVFWHFASSLSCRRRSCLAIPIAGNAKCFADGPDLRFEASA